MQADAGTKIDHSALRADLVIESFKASTSKQVKHAALSLISSLVIVAPEVIIHGIMPVFIFMEKDTLRESDEYSAHVVDQVSLSLVGLPTKRVLIGEDDFFGDTAPSCLIAQTEGRALASFIQVTPQFCGRL